MWALDHKESWTLKNQCFWTVVLEKTLESPRGNQPWYLLEGLMRKPKLQYFGHLRQSQSTWLMRKDPDAGKDWRQEEKGTTEDEMVGWHHWLDRHEFEQAPGVGDGQGSLVCCNPWGQEKSDMTVWLNWTECIKIYRCQNQVDYKNIYWASVGGIN